MKKKQIKHISAFLIVNLTHLWRNNHMPFRNHLPLDPECPDVIDFYEGHAEDPISQMSGCMGEITNDFESRHRANCTRCQEYGAANIEVTD
jgi:hypothetical protein